MTKVHTLRDHLDECETRYRDIITRIDGLDTRLDTMERLLLEIKLYLTDQRRASSSHYKIATPKT